MTDETEHDEQRAEIFERVCDLVEELESEGACGCCAATVLLGQANCADAIASLSPLGVFRDTPSAQRSNDSTLAQPQRKRCAALESHRVLVPSS
jgi:hypothetical protein